jgi:hypothetical protein
MLHLDTGNDAICYKTGFLGKNLIVAVPYHVNGSGNYNFFASQAIFLGIS